MSRGEGHGPWEEYRPVRVVRRPRPARADTSEARYPFLMPAEFIYTSYKLARHYPPDRTVLEDISISFYPGAKIGVIGSNGAGKSSLLRIMAGLDDGFTGEARLTPGFTVGYLSQEPQLDPTKDVKQNVLDGVRPVQDLIDAYNAVMAKWSDPDADYEAIGAEQAALEDKINAADAWNLERNVDIAMDALRCPPDDADVTTLSGGEKRRVALCRLLLQHPDLLLLDEPTNHLDAESVEWLERFLDEYAGTVVAVTHDRYFLDNVAKWILELDRGRGIPFSGNYSSWLEQKLDRMAKESKSIDAKQRTLARELEWVRMGAKARQAKGKARLTAYEKLLAEANDTKDQTRELEIAIPPGPRLGDTVIEVKDLRKGYGDRLLIEDLTFSLPKAGIVGIIGPNGAGKTTLFRMLVGQEAPDAGSIEIGDTVQMSYVDQSRDDLDADKNVFQEITQGAEFIKTGAREVPARAYVSSFNFRGTDQQKLVGQLSGGERNRVHLAKLLQSGGNVLLLDEPTNDLDVDTLRALEAGLESFPGCAVVISHDRWFLDRIATHILAFEGDSQVRWFEGNVSDYEAFRRKELGTAADQPHRIKYKKLVA
jgi:sulfate-transporting ATPase